MEGDFDSSWSVLSLAIKEIHRKDASPLSFEELYRTAYTLVIRKHGKRLYEAVKSEIKSHLNNVVQTVLLPKYAKCSAGSLSSCAPLAPPEPECPAYTQNTALSKPNIEILTLVLEVWNDHCVCMRMISDILMYLDRVYSQEAKVPLIYDAGLCLFRDVVFNSPLQNDIYYNVLGFLRHDRLGAAVEIPVIKSVVNMLEYLPHTLPSGDSIYVSRFEPLLLADTENYYEKAAADLLAKSHDAAIYIQKTKQWINSEWERVNLFMLAASLAKLQEKVHHVLITERFPTVLGFEQTGFRKWIEADNYPTIKLTYDLYSLVTSTFDVINGILQNCVEESGTEINQRAKAALQATKHAKQAAHGGKPKESEKGKNAKGKSAKGRTDTLSPTSIAIQWVENVLLLKNKFQRIILESFNKNTVIYATVDASFSAFINKNQKVSEYLSLYIDDNLKKSLKGKSDSEIEETLEKSISLFRFIADKDVFENYYKAHLAKRLLNAKSLSEDIEKNLISKLKMEIGTSYTSKLDGMFRDMKLSKDMITKYKDRKKEQLSGHSQNLAAGVTQPAELPQPATKPADIGLFVNVLTSTFWPTSVVSTHIKCNFPPEIEAARQDFERFYFSLHSGRKLAWNPNLGTADIKVRFAKRVHEINMPTLAMIILLQFSEITDGTGLTFGQLEEATNIPKTELIRHLQSLAVAPRTRILKKTPMSKDIKPTDKFFFNTKFESNMTRFKVLTVASGNKLETDAEKSGTMAKVEQSRKLETDAAIVRIMKARKTLEHIVLVSEVVKQLASRFKPEPSLIKSCIDSLLEREYLERDPNKRSVYNYLA